MYYWSALCKIDVYRQGISGIAVCIGMYCFIQDVFLLGGRGGWREDDCKKINFKLLVVFFLFPRKEAN